MKERTADEVARQARLRNGEPALPTLVDRDDYKALLKGGAEVVSFVEEPGEVHVILVYDGLRFGHVLRTPRPARGRRIRIH